MPFQTPECGSSIATAARLRSLEILLPQSTTFRCTLDMDMEYGTFFVMCKLQWAEYPVRCAMYEYTEYTTDCATALLCYMYPGGGVYTGFPNRTRIRALNHESSWNRYQLYSSSASDGLRPDNGCEDSPGPLQLQSDYSLEYRTLQLQRTGYRVPRAPERRVGSPVILPSIIAPTIRPGETGN